MDEVISKSALVLRQLAHLSKIDLIMIFETVENMLEVFGIAWDIESHSNDGY